MNRQFRLFRQEDGQSTLLAAFGLAAIMGCLALAIDAGQLRYQKRQLQAAADAAALAATLEFQYCNGVPACPAMQNAAISALAENGLNGVTVVTNCGTAPQTAGVILTINQPACAMSASDPNSGKSGFIETLVTQGQTSSFAGLVGSAPLPLTARAEAARTGGSNCVYALDPAGSGALTVQTLAVVNAVCGIMIESSSSSAVSCALLAAISSSQLSIVGNVSNFLCAIFPTAITNAALPSPADPLAYLSTPTIPACGSSASSPYHGSASALTITGTAVLYPDAAYCGGISVKFGANVTLQPGTYVMTSSNGGAARNPGGLSIDLGATVSGSGVTIYNYGPNGGINLTFSNFLLGGVNLTAPTSGTYGGILFFQDKGNTNTANILGSPVWSTVLEGAYYFPKARVNFAFDGPVRYNILVAYDITFQALTFGSTSLSSGFYNNYSSLATGSPLNEGGAVISE